MAARCENKKNIRAKSEKLFNALNPLIISIMMCKLILISFYYSS